MTELKNEFELTLLINKRNELINQRAFMRRNCDIIVLQSKRLDHDAYNSVISALTQKIRQSSIEIKNLRAKIYPDNRRTKKALAGVEHILRGL